MRLYSCWIELMKRVIKASLWIYAIMAHLFLCLWVNPEFLSILKQKFQVVGCFCRLVTSQAHHLLCSDNQPLRHAGQGWRRAVTWHLMTSGGRQGSDMPVAWQLTWRHARRQVIVVDIFKKQRKTVLNESFMTPRHYVLTCELLLYNLASVRHRC